MDLLIASTRNAALVRHAKAHKHAKHHLSQKTDFYANNHQVSQRLSLIRFAF